MSNILFFFVCFIKYECVFCVGSNCIMGLKEVIKKFCHVMLKRFVTVGCLIWEMSCFIGINFKGPWWGKIFFSRLNFFFVLEFFFSDLLFYYLQKYLTKLLKILFHCFKKLILREKWIKVFFLTKCQEFQKKFAFEKF